VGFVVDKVAAGQVFSEYFGFRCQFAFHRLLHNHPHLSSGAKQWPQYQVDSVSPHEKKKIQSLSQLMDSTKSTARSAENSQVNNTGGTYARLSAKSGCPHLLLQQTLQILVTALPLAATISYLEFTAHMERCSNVW
jgi:hypothetical protein